VVVSFASVKTEEGDLDSEYVLEIDEACDGSYWAVSLSDGSFRVYGKNSSTANILSPANPVLAAHKTPSVIKTLKCSTNSPHVIYTGHEDGMIFAWDLRAPMASASSRHGMRLQLPAGDELTSFDISGADTLLAAAAGTSVLFYDIRRAMSSSAGMSSDNNNKCQVLGQYSDCHSDLVTQVRFNKSRPSVLASAGEDGLLCTYDTAAPANTEAVVSVLNTECPIRNFFFFGQDLTGICCMSSIETLSCWHYPSAQRICHFPDLRASHSLDYLVDGWYDNSSDSLFVLGGDYSGNASILGVSPAGLTVAGSMRGGHSAGLRCCLPTATGGVITGAEDAKLCSWGSGGVSTSTGTKPTGAQSHSRPIKSKARGVGLSSTPY
jgi:WD40 repeat protein